MTNLKSIGSIKYFPDFNRILSKRNGKEFFQKENRQFFRKCLDFLLQEIVPVNEGEDIHLGYFYAVPIPLGYFIPSPTGFLSLIIFPTKGEIERYSLNPKGDFVTNTHQNPDPLLIYSIGRNLHFHPEITDEFIWVPGRKAEQIPNLVNGAVLFKRNPVEHQENYPGFNEFLDAKDYV